MRLFEVSDVHTEVLSDGGWSDYFKHVPYDAFDVLILAGDILNCTDLDRFLLTFDRICEKTRVVYIPGNHEYWATNKTPQAVWETVIYPAEDKLKDRLFVLKAGRVFELDGQRFVGDTMWFPDSPEAQQMMPTWPEARHIKLYRPWVFNQNHAWRRSAKMDMKPGDIVVTHHSPSFQSVPVRYKGHGQNCFYIDGAMENMMLHKKPKLWFHGHTHEAFDYTIGDTRVICNPRGHATEQTGFDPNKIIEV